MCASSSLSVDFIPLLDCFNDDLISKSLFRWIENDFLIDSIYLSFSCVCGCVRAFCVGFYVHIDWKLMFCELGTNCQVTCFPWKTSKSMKISMWKICYFVVFNYHNTNILYFINLNTWRLILVVIGKSRWHSSNIVDGSSVKSIHQSNLDFCLK